MTPSRRPLRIALIAVAAVIVLVVGIAAVAIARFDPNTYKPDIVAAVKRATGRDLALNGKISLKPSLWPTIQVGDVTFSNPPGFSRPQMASLQGMELQLGLLPLLSGQFAIERLVLIHPDILLETDAAGHSNWQMTPEVSPARPRRHPVPGQIRRRHTDRGQRRLHPHPGRHDRLSRRPHQQGHHAGSAEAGGDRGVPGLAAASGCRRDLQRHRFQPGRRHRQPEPVAGSGRDLALAGEADADGRQRENQRRRIADPAAARQGLQPGGERHGARRHALTPLLQGFVPPPLHDVTFAAKVADKGGPLPEFSALTLHVGASDLGAQVPGLTLDHLDIAAAAADQPAKARCRRQAGRSAAVLRRDNRTAGPLLPDAKPAPFPVDASVQAAGATVSAKGTIADARAMTGANVALAAQIPTCRRCRRWRGARCRR